MIQDIINMYNLDHHQMFPIKDIQTLSFVYLSAHRKLLLLSISDKIKQKLLFLREGAERY